MKEISPGDTIVCVETTYKSGCDNCVFHYSETCECNIECQHFDKSDGKDVHFELVKKKEDENT